MPNYDFQSPGAGFTGGLQQAMLQQQELQRRSMLEQRQQMMDELQRKNVESEIANRSSEADDRKANRAIQEHRAALEDAQAAKLKEDEALKELGQTPIGTPITPSLKSTIATAHRPDLIAGAGHTLSSTSTIGGAPLPQTNQIGAQAIQSQAQPNPLAVTDPISSATNRKEAVRAAIAAGVPFDKINELVNQKFGADKTKGLGGNAIAPAPLTREERGIETEGVYAGLPVQVAAQKEESDNKHWMNAITNAPDRQSAMKAALPFANAKNQKDIDGFINTMFKDKETLALEELRQEGRLKAAKARGSSSVAGARQAEDKTDVKDTVQGMIEGTIPPQLPSRSSREYFEMTAEAKRQGFNLVKANEDWVATQKYLSTLNSQQQVRLRQAVGFSKESLGIVEDLAKQWHSTTNVQVLNKINLAAAKNGAYGEQLASVARRLDAQIADLTSELGTVYKGGNSSTDDSLKLAATNLGSNWSEKVLMDGIKQVRQNLTMREHSINYGAPIANEGNPYAPRTGPPPGVISPSSGPTPSQRRDPNWDGR